jgi:hypothetical protein
MDDRTIDQELNEGILTKIINNIQYRLLDPVELWLYRFLSEDEYTRRMYRRLFNREIDLQHPETFNEKILYLKLYHSNEEYTQLADKVLVRDFVRNRGLGSLLNEVYGVYERIDEIDLDSLPNSFIIQATHGSGWNIICEDKAQLDWNAARAKMRRWMKTNFYWRYREGVYKNVQPRIIISKYLSGENGNPPDDYKFFCFHGEPVYVQVDTQRYTNHRRDFFDIQWNHLPLCLNYPNSERPLEKPDTLEEMMRIARILSQGFPFLRVDLYSLSGRVIFGELTLYPGAGFTRFQPERYDYIFGQELYLEAAE